MTPLPNQPLLEKELLELYLEGMDVKLLSSHFNCKSREIISLLSELLLGIENPQRDTTAKRYGKKWDFIEDCTFRKMFALGRSPIEIAAQLTRDELGVCYRVLTRILVVVPPEIVERFKLDQAYPYPSHALSTDN